MAYINNGGLPLFRKFVRHLSNYSVMQVVERLFLHQPGWEGQSVQQSIDSSNPTQ